MKETILSICIPTYGRIEVLEKTLYSIFDQAVDSTLYEVCIADNSPTDETKILLENHFKEFKNIVYKKNSSCGYLNSIEALRMGTGEYLKLHNNYSCFAPGMLYQFIRAITDCKQQKPVMFFTSGELSNNHFLEYKNFNSFINALSYWSTWSASFGIWRTDFQNISDNIKPVLSSMFPHTSLLFTSSYKDHYIIDNKKYFIHQNIVKKGGYHITEVFCVDYLGMVNNLVVLKMITKKTYRKIKHELLYKFIVSWFCNIKINPRNFTFEIAKSSTYLHEYYNHLEIILFYIFVTIQLPLRYCIFFIRSILKNRNND